MDASLTWNCGWLCATWLKKQRKHGVIQCLQYRIPECHAPPASSSLISISLGWQHLAKTLSALQQRKEGQTTTSLTLWLITLTDWLSDWQLTPAALITPEEKRLSTESDYQRKTSLHTTRLHFSPSGKIQCSTETNNTDSQSAANVRWLQ